LLAGLILMGAAGPALADHGVAAEPAATDSPALGGFDVGVGSVTLRYASVTMLRDNHSDLYHVFIGPTLQRRVAPHISLDIGAGASLLHTNDYGCAILDTTSPCLTTGAGVDARVAYTWSRGPHAVNVSVETNPGVYAGSGERVVFGLALLVGYQYL
jgi:hypothetical protein